MTSYTNIVSIIAKNPQLFAKSHMNSQELVDEIMEEIAGEVHISNRTYLYFRAIEKMVMFNVPLAYIGIPYDLARPNLVEESVMVQNAKKQIKMYNDTDIKLSSKRLTGEKLLHNIKKQIYMHSEQKQNDLLCNAHTVQDLLYYQDFHTIMRALFKQMYPKCTHVFSYFNSALCCYLLVSNGYVTKKDMELFLEMYNG